MSNDRDRHIARRARNIGLVIAGGGLAVILAPFIVRGLALPIRFEMLFYLGALAAFVWALVNIYQIWRMRRDNRG